MGAAHQDVPPVSPSEQQFQGKLNLPRRTEIPGRKARALNLAERPAGRRQNRIAKVWMIENIEELTSELKGDFFSDLRIFPNGEIRVQEVRNGVAAQVSRVAASGSVSPAKTLQVFEQRVLRRMRKRKRRLGRQMSLIFSENDS